MGLRRNGSGYVDPTAYKALSSVVKDEREAKQEKRAKKVLETIYNIVELAGFRVDSRIILKDTRTGRKWG